ncbi:hypothetical protein ACP_1378 [Acidobacterium capsulatum ATCC 51196]|uniref:Uncharacterized protein n=1 Tax=Acidobacterium capsulatum (strain ATCC 51196 / DSM 11244 / BCRC 80197 / JCM 7670 / NBRC 15755 / NCIMB 13165 / 161) TaxID=240015 RepID=C1F5X1_ACIC5|nr:hypothetical protein ACP_1378 [Acidobacterium capsulatum ATCC 51196]
MNPDSLFEQAERRVALHLQNAVYFPAFAGFLEEISVLVTMQHCGISASGACGK